MAALTDSQPWVEEAFLSAKEEFLRNLVNKREFDFSGVVTPEDVINAALAIQEKQAKTKTFRGLSRIKPLIAVLQEYCGVVDTFVQVKPDVLGLIWGPLKFILQTASTLTAAFEKTVKILGDIQLILPSFKKYRQVFPQNEVIRQVLLLFFEDILNLYSVLLNFATQSRLRKICEPFWPGVQAKIDKIREHIENHKALITESVTREDIVRAQEARNLALAEYDRAQKSRDHQAFCAVRDEINPEKPYGKLNDVLEQTIDGSGIWLDKEEKFMNWLDPVDRTVRYFWLCGIPGAGKTFLAGNIIKRLQRTEQVVLFSFLSYERQSVGKILPVLHSLLFQALEQVPSLQGLLPDYSSPDRRKLLRDQDFVQKILCAVLISIGPTYIVIDGLDEIEESSWKSILTAVFSLKDSCVEAKVLISSREVREIALVLKDRVTALRIDKHNHEDIQSFVRHETENLLLRFGDADEQVRSRIRAAVELIADKSDGMFLYAKLVLDVVKDYGTPDEIQAEVENLPDGLNGAYGRIISRIERKDTSKKLRGVIRRLLMWIACATRPLREEELLQVLVVDIGADDFTRGRKEYRDIRRDCGPIIEVVDGVVRFVHFSAKEYLLHEQSNNFLKPEDAHLDAALTCTTYLSFTSLDSLLSTTWEVADIQQQILNGDFVLLEYAALEYMEHIKAWMSNKTHEEDSMERLSTALRYLFDIRRNYFFNSQPPSESFIADFKVFQTDPDLQQCLARAASFLTGVKIGIINMDEATGTSKEDPLDIFPALVVFRQRLEDMACEGPGHSPGCECLALNKLYGPRLYHCRRPFCSAYTSGFETKRLLTEHLGVHSVNHRCHFPSCLFADTGFRSEDELSRHLQNTHETPNLPDFNIGANQLAGLPEQDQVRLLYDAVASGRFDAVRQLASPSVVAKAYELIKLAGSHSPPDLLLWLLNHEHYAKTSSERDESMINTALHAAIEGENLPNIKALLSRGADITSVVGLYTYAIRSYTKPFNRDQFEYVTRKLHGLLRALRRWNGALMKFLVEECGVTLPVTWHGDKDDLGKIFGASYLSEVTLEDARRRFSAIKPYIVWEKTYTTGPYYSVLAGSPSLLRISLENGGDPNKDMPLHESVEGDNVQMTEILLEFKADPNLLDEKRKATPIQGVSKESRNSKMALEHARLLLRHGADINIGNDAVYYSVKHGRAEMVKLLLQHGANPNQSKGKKKIDSLAGMKKVEKYFGIPWSDIVRRIQAGEDLQGSGGRTLASG